MDRRLLYPITLYFFLFSQGRAHRFQPAISARVLGRHAAPREVFRHLFTFACVLLDRLFLLSNRLRHFRIDVIGVDHVTSALAQGTGMRTARLSSRQLRGVARLCPAIAGAGQDPDVPGQHAAPTAGSWSGWIRRWPMPSSRSARPRRCCAFASAWSAGEIVGILADRAPAGQKMVSVPFLGAPAPLPTGPLLLCAALGVPVVLFFGVRTGARRYKVHFEPFADRIVLQRSRRAEDVAGWVSAMRNGLKRIAAAIRSTGSTSMISGKACQMLLHRRRLRPAAAGVIAPAASRGGAAAQRTPEAAIDELMQMLAQVPRAAPPSPRSRHSPC